MLLAPAVAAVEAGEEKRRREATEEEPPPAVRDAARDAKENIG